MVNNDGSPEPFDARAALRRFQDSLPDLMQEAGAKLSDGSTVAAIIDEDLQAALDEMRESAKRLDPGLQPQAGRAIAANEKWIKAAASLANAEARGDTAAAMKSQQDLEQASVAMQTFELLQGMGAALHASSVALDEIKQINKTANTRQASQEKFNSRMTWAALLIAGGSFLVPIADHFFWEEVVNVVIYDVGAGSTPRGVVLR